MKYSDRLYLESCELITANPDLTSDNIPYEILKAWFCDEKIEIGQKMLCFSDAVFTFAYDKLRGGECNDYNNLVAVFRRMVNLEMLSRVMPMKLKSVKVFDFGNYYVPLILNVKDVDIDDIVAVNNMLQEIPSPQR